MTETNKEQLRKLYTKYNLTSDDIFTSPQGWTIITRGGIDKVQSKSGIEINYDLVAFDAATKTYVVKAIASYEDKTIESYGESSPDNTKQKYPVAMAEKRAMSRVVLKLAGFYEIGVYGQDESDDFNIPKGSRSKITNLIEETLV